MGADDDTARTADDELVESLRRQGLIGPFAVADWGAHTDVGLRRQRNEDRWRGDPAIGAVVTDGMGGRVAGDLAAEAAAQAAFAHLAGLPEAGAGELVTRAHAAVVRAGAEHGAERLGTTLVALAVHHGHVVIVHVGDSRAYRLRDGELEQLTRDHTVRAELDAAGVPHATAEQARVRLDALTAYLGSGFPPGFRAATFSVMGGDRFLLCSDGVHGQLDPAALAGALGAGTCTDAARSLVNAANAAGGRDNSTAVVFEFETVLEGPP